jgi:hypothetical protein
LKALLPDQVSSKSIRLTLKLITLKSHELIEQRAKKEERVLRVGVRVSELKRRFTPNPLQLYMVHTTAHLDTGQQEYVTQAINTNC